ncbi:uroporphyrinogen-III synthase [Qipengyuania spongiae]|uniref:Uroporphyrinogen-III synthase n=1 Tax=Qipengyuania spongiae TaxID=2909673 RepID=A0ABY5T4X3_9SPHN|nr:uroporphyrinogen-III synthase [Qipengyuania spongiae]UVI40659.1 uroporphyrinogen-III synthase [Qipengyuania spongiae]
MLLRPEPGWSASAARAKALGLEVRGAPLTAIEPLEWEMPRGSFDALLIGSANVFRHGGASLARLRDLPVCCVGEATARAARGAGFDVRISGDGELQGVVDRIIPPARLLRLMGEERVDLIPPQGVEIIEIAVYRNRTIPLDRADLPDAAVVALHSAATARQFSREVERLKHERSRFALCAISRRVAEAAGPGWRAVGIAETPDDAALLALAKRLCQDLPDCSGGFRGTQNG